MEIEFTLSRNWTLSFNRDKPVLCFPRIQRFINVMSNSVSRFREPGSSESEPPQLFQANDLENGSSVQRDAISCNRRQSSKFIRLFVWSGKFWPASSVIAVPIIRGIAISARKSAGNRTNLLGGLRGEITLTFRVCSRSNEIRYFLCQYASGPIAARDALLPSSTTLMHTKKLPTRASDQTWPATAPREMR